MQEAEFLSGFLAPTEAERRLLSAARNGEECVLGERPPQAVEPGARPEPPTDASVMDAPVMDAIDAAIAGEPADAAATRAPADDGATVRAEFLRALILSGEGGPKIHESGLRLRGARIVGLLNLAGCHIGHIVGLRRCRFEEPVLLSQAEARSLAFDGSIMPGFYGDRIETTGSLYLRADGDQPFIASDSVSLVSARIGGDLRLRGGRFAYKGGLAARMGELTGARRERLDEYAAAVSLHKASVRGTLDLRQAILESGSLDLALTTLHTLRVFQEDIERELAASDAMPDDQVGDRLILDGLIYRHIPIGLAGDAATLRRFLLMQIDEHLGVASLEDYRKSHQGLETEAGLAKLKRIFETQNKIRPQPFEQLGRVLREMGYEEVAREIAVFKQRRRRRSAGEFSSFGSAIHWLFGLAAGFGYRPLRAVGWLVAFWLIGAGLSLTAYRAGGLAPTPEIAAARAEMAQAQSKVSSVRFEALVYSADVLLPFVALKQDAAWAPAVETPPGLALHYYNVAQVALGWILSALAIAGVTGIVQRR